MTEQGAHLDFMPGNSQRPYLRPSPIVLAGILIGGLMASGAPARAQVAPGPVITAAGDPDITGDPSRELARLTFADGYFRLLVQGLSRAQDQGPDLAWGQDHLPLLADRLRRHALAAG